MHGPANALIRAAAADIGHRLVDVGIGRRRVLLEQRDRGHDLAGLAVAALRHLLFDPRLLDRMAAIGRDALDRGDRVLAHRTDGHAARPRRLAVDVYRAGAALL